MMQTVVQHRTLASKTCQLLPSRSLPTVNAVRLRGSSSSPSLPIRKPRLDVFKTAAASPGGDKPLKDLVANEDNQFFLAVGAVFGITITVCAVLVVNALNFEVEVPEKAATAESVGIAPIVTSKELDIKSLPKAPAVADKPAPKPAPVPRFSPAEAPAPSPSPAPAVSVFKAADGTSKHLPRSIASVERQQQMHEQWKIRTAAPTADAESSGSNQLVTLVGGIIVSGAAGALLIASQGQQAGDAAGAPSAISTTAAAAGGDSIASRKAAAQQWISAWRVRTGEDIAVRQRAAQNWVAAWRKRTGA